jgi:peptidoglycan hydrolase-like protein with peptidoglycan-binding domain
MAPPVISKAFTDLILTRGDSDKAKKWGGSRQPGSGGTPVADLQNALVAVGVLEGQADGEFGKNTQEAIRRFQWNVSNIKFRLINGLLQPRQVTIPVTVNGTSDANTSKELKNWVDAGAVTTGNLIRVQIANYAQLERGEIKKINNPSVGDDDIVIDADFFDSLGILNDEAKTGNVKLALNQAFRIHGAPVGGAVVPPASKSQHLIGHAIDCNIDDGGLISSKALAKHKETAAADDFIAAVKKRGLRWGGDFDDPDPVHFDDNVDPKGDGYLMRFFFNQRTISKKQQIRAVP